MCVRNRTVHEYGKYQLNLYFVITKQNRMRIQKGPGAPTMLGVLLYRNDFFKASQDRSSFTNSVVILYLTLIYVKDHLCSKTCLFWKCLKA